MVWKLGVCALLSAGFATIIPSAAEAAPAPETVTIATEVFPTGGALSGSLSGRVSVYAGAKVTLTAPEYVYEPPSTSSTPSTTSTTGTTSNYPSLYEFMFWDADATPFSTEKATFTVPASASNISATAWYLAICVPGVTAPASSSCGGGTPTLSTWAFSLTKHEVLTETPISSVTGAPWTAPSATVPTTTPPVKVTAFSFLGTHSKFGGTEFSSWFVLGAPSAITISGIDLTVNAAISAYAIAFYNEYTGPMPPPVPCVGYPHCV